MDKFFFVEIDNLVEADLGDASEKKLYGTMEPWVNGEPLVALRTEKLPQKHNEAAQYVVFTKDALYFFDFAVEPARVIKVKCFAQKAVIAHAFMLGNGENEAQVRVMMDNELKLKFGLAGGAAADSLLQKIAACPFFAPQ